MSSIRLAEEKRLARQRLGRSGESPPVLWAWQVRLRAGGPMAMWRATGETQADVADGGPQGTMRS